MMKKRGIQIAIDGHSSCGKSTFAQMIAKELGYTYIDTGAMYRAVTLAFLRANIPHPEELSQTELERFLDGITVGFTAGEGGTLPRVTLGGEVVEHAIRGSEVSNMVSRVAALAPVRDWLVAQQQALGKRGGVVMDGRDIGTVVLPDAELKLFMTADLDVRAQRRYLELQQKGIEGTLAGMRANLAERDAIDQGREYNPLRQAPDAILLDNTHLTLNEQMEQIKPLIEERIRKAQG